MAYGELLMVIDTRLLNSEKCMNRIYIPLGVNGRMKSNNKIVSDSKLLIMCYLFVFGGVFPYLYLVQV